MSKEFIARRTSHVEFELAPGKTLVINLETNLGLDRIIIRRGKNGEFGVTATGHSDFEFKKKRETANASSTDFVLENPGLKASLTDYIAQKFWSQFGWGELFYFDRDKKSRSEINKKIKSLVAAFEAKASKELNSMPEVKRIFKGRKR